MDSPEVCSGVIHSEVALAAEDTGAEGSAQYNPHFALHFFTHYYPLTVMRILKLGNDSFEFLTTKHDNSQSLNSLFLYQFTPYLP